MDVAEAAAAAAAMRDWAEEPTDFERPLPTMEVPAELTDTPPPPPPVDIISEAGPPERTDLPAPPPPAAPAPLLPIVGGFGLIGFVGVKRLSKLDTAAAAAAAAIACEPPEEAATASAAAASKSVILLLSIEEEEDIPPPPPPCLILLASIGLTLIGKTPPPPPALLVIICNVLLMLGEVTGEVVVVPEVPTVELDFFSFGGVARSVGDEEVISFEKPEEEEDTSEDLPPPPLGEARSR